jgi:molybdopterin molybdotransferase
LRSSRRARWPTAPSSRTAIKLFTGSVIPAGADTVVRVEDTDNGSEVVTISRATPQGVAVRRAGEDLRRGERVLARGTLLRHPEIGVLASIGCGTVLVHQRRRSPSCRRTGLVEVDAIRVRGRW